MCTLVDDSARAAGSGLEPPFVRAPIWTFPQRAGLKVFFFFFEAEIPTKQVLSRPDPCSVDFGCETPEFPI